MNKDSTKITKEEFQNKSKLIIDTTKEQIDSVIVHAKKQIMVEEIYSPGKMRPCQKSSY